MQFEIITGAEITKITKIRKFENVYNFEKICEKAKYLGNDWKNRK